MTRSTWTLAFLFLALISARTAGISSDIGDPHIRSSEAELLAAVHDGIHLSPTLQHIVGRLETSDVIVYLMFNRPAAAARPTAHISLLATSAGRRYLRVTIDRSSTGCERIALLGHELHHALEIAESPSVTDEAGLAALYRRIGFRSVNDHTDCFDSVGAILAGQLIARELRGRYTDLTFRSR
jgi:hypothetical protein